MDTLIGTLIVFALAVAAMSVGVAFTGRALKGSCGGTGGKCPCTETEKRACEHRARGAA